MKTLKQRDDYWKCSFNDIPASLTDRQGQTFRPEHKRTHDGVLKPTYRHTTRNWRHCANEHSDADLLTLTTAISSYWLCWRIRPVTSYTASFKAAWWSACNRSGEELQRCCHRRYGRAAPSGSCMHHHVQFRVPSTQRIWGSCKVLAYAVINGRVLYPRWVEGRSKGRTSRATARGAKTSLK